MRPAALLPLVLLAAPAAAQTQLQLNEKAAADFRRADTGLNAQYRVTMAAARHDGADAVAGLIDAQRAWVRFRDAECERQSFGSIGGSIHPMDDLICRTTLTRNRIQQLKVPRR